MTPEMLVWLSTPRARIAYHLIDGRKTVCGRYVGEMEDPAHGAVMPLADATIRFDSEICRRCAGTAEVVAPRGVPSRDRS